MQGRHACFYYSSDFDFYHKHAMLSGGMEQVKQFFFFVFLFFYYFKLVLKAIAKN